MTKLRDGLDSLNGRNITDAIQKFGYPDQEREMFGKTIYTWGTQSTGTSSRPVMNAYGQIYAYAPVSVSYNCKIEIVTADAGKIETWQLDGNRRGCSRYADAF